MVEARTIDSKLEEETGHQHFGNPDRRSIEGHEGQEQCEETL